MRGPAGTLLAAALIPGDAGHGVHVSIELALCGWVTVAVGHDFGSQLGYSASREPAGTQSPPRAYHGIYDEPVDGEERLHGDVDAAWIVFTSVVLSPLVGVARVAIWTLGTDD